jgi:acetyltransferase-like isoleucine patch superfamily enzyme
LKYAKIQDAKLLGNAVIGRYVNLHGNVKIGHYTTIGDYSIIHASQSKILIGNYCAISPHVSMYAVNHAVDYLTIYNNHQLLQGNLKSIKSKNPIFIGHDVWIGHGAVILSGVSIGNGSIIGANSVVTKNIPNYSIAVGNPAKVKKKRFNDEIIDLILATKWWEYSPQELEKYEKLFFSDLNKDSETGKKQLQLFIDDKDKKVKSKCHCLHS